MITALALLTLTGLIHVLIELLVLAIVIWLILYVCAQLGAPPLVRTLVLVIGCLIAIVVLLSLITPLGAGL